VSRPPALDPEAERWAARFETLPPAAEDPARKRSGRWKTQVMGSMVPLEVVAAREERVPLSDAPLSAAPPGRPLSAPPNAVASVVHRDVPAGWRSDLDAFDPQVSGLRDQVMQHGQARRLGIVVTGAFGESKAKVAAGLALALAKVGARVLLVEADFDQPRLHQVLGLDAPAGAGFSQQMITRLHDQQPQQRPWIMMRCSPNLQALVEGRFRSPGLLASRVFENAIVELRDQYHVVIMAGPATSTPGDLRALDGLAEAVVLVQSDGTAVIDFGPSSLRALL
jgi:Mrp family chromosome partitioning ATPase